MKAIILVLAACAAGPASTRDSGADGGATTEKPNRPGPCDDLEPQQDCICTGTAIIENGAGLGAYSECDIIEGDLLLLGDPSTPNSLFVREVWGDVLVGIDYRPDLRNTLNLLEVIQGDLTIIPCVSGIETLHRLREVGGTVDLACATNYTDGVEPLSALEQVGGGVRISRPQFGSLDGLGAIESLQFLTVSSGSLSSLDGLGGLVSLGYLSVSAVADLERLDGLANIEELGKANASNNPALCEDEARAFLTRFTEDVALEGNREGC